MEEDIKISKVEYLRNHLLDQTQILNLGSDDQTFSLQILKRKMTSIKYKKGNTSATIYRIKLKF